MNFGPLLRARRIAKHMTQQALADCIGRDRSYISAIEHERVPPPGEQSIRRMAQALGINESDLVLKSGQIPSTLKSRLSNPYARSLIRLLSEKPMEDITYRKMLYWAQKDGTQ